jgi:hypothetical protein
MLESQMTMKELLASIDARNENQSCETPTFEAIFEETPVEEKKEIKKDEKKEEKPKIYIPKFAYPFKRISNHDKEKSTYDLMMESLFIDKDAQYLFNSSGLFHGGIHLNGDKFCGNTFDKKNIRAIADGKVIAYRIDDEPLENEVSGETLLYTTGFFLIEHHMEYPVGNKLKFYSLYMHMAAKEEYEFPTYVLCGGKEYVRKGSASGDGVPNTFGKEVTLTGEKVGDRFVVATLDDEEASEKLVVHKSNLIKKEELHSTTTKGTGINLRYHQKGCKSWKSLKIATEELKSGVSIVVASKKLKCNRYEVISVDGKFIVESNDKEDKTKKVEQMVSISASNLAEIPKAPKNSKDSFENGLVSEKMKTNEVVELEEKEQIEVKAGDVLGRLGLYSYDWIEEPIVHLEVFTFDDVKAFQKEATDAYEKVDEEKKYKVGGKTSTPLVQGWRNSSWVLEEQVHYVKAGTPITVTQRKKKVGGVTRQKIIEIDGSSELVKEGVWTIWEKQVEVQGKKDERPKPNILYVPKETTEIFEKGYDNTIYAKVTKNTNIRKGTTNDGDIYGKKTTKKGTELVLGTTTTETKVPKSKEKEASSYYRQSVLEIAGKEVEGYSIHTAFFEIIQKDVFTPKESNQKLKTPIVQPMKNLKIEKDKDDVEYIEIAKSPSLYVKKYKDEKQTKSWFTHGVTLKMFDVMEKEGKDKIGIFEDTVSFYDKREENKKTQEERETLNPLFNEILGKLRIDKDKNGKLEAGELAGLSLTQEKQKELSYLVAKHESEWEDATRFEALATFMDEMKATEYATMMRDRTKKLSFFDDVMAMDFSPTFFHPLALVGAMERSYCEQFDWSKTPIVKLIIGSESKGKYTAYNVTSYQKNGKTYSKFQTIESNYNAGDGKSFHYDITSMTLAEIKEAQRYDNKDFPKTHVLAVGLYQLIPDTFKLFLSWIKKKKSVDESTQLLDENFQDLMALFFWESKQKGIIGKYFRSKNTVEESALAISREWASMGLPSGHETVNNGKDGIKITSDGIKKVGRYQKWHVPTTKYPDGRYTNIAFHSGNEVIEALKKTKVMLDAYGGYEAIVQRAYSDSSDCNEIEEVEEVSSDTKVILKITRYKEWAKNFTSSNKNIQQGGTLSKYSLSVDGIEKTTGYMLEAAGEDTKVADTDCRILEGTYSLMKNPGKAGNFRLVQLTKELSNKYFGDRYQVNIHTGNKPEHVEGCFMTGKSTTETGKYPSVHDSKAAYKIFKKIIIENSKVEHINSYDGKFDYTTNVYVDVEVIIKNNF